MLQVGSNISILQLTPNPFPLPPHIQPVLPISSHFLSWFDHVFWLFREALRRTIVTSSEFLSSLTEFITKVTYYYWQSPSLFRTTIIWRIRISNVTPGFKSVVLYKDEYMYKYSWSALMLVWKKEKKNFGGRSNFMSLEQ